MRSLRDWTPGNSVRNNAHHQQAVLALRELQGQVAGILPGEEQLYLNGYPAMIVDEGPDGEDDFTDARYWVKRQLIEASEYGDALTFAEDWSDQALTDQANAGGSPGQDGIQATPSVVPATNLAEWATGGGSHGMPTDGTCLVWIVETDAQGHDDLENLSTLKRVFSRVVTGVMVKPTANAVGGGKYTGTIWTPPTIEVDLTTDLAEADLGTAGGAVLILNTREVGQNTHDIEFTGFLPLIFPATYLRTNADGVRVYAIDGRQGEPCEEA